MTTWKRRMLTRLSAALLVLAVVPGRVLAADPPEVTTSDGAPATLLVILLLGSLTAGIFFASPLRRRFARGSFASTGVPARWAQLPAAQRLERISEQLHDRLARATRRWPAMSTATPLPPMLGGDIFFDDDPSTAPTARPSPTPRRTLPAGAAASPWSTSPLAADERYLPLR